MHGNRNGKRIGKEVGNRNGKRIGREVNNNTM